MPVMRIYERTGLKTELIPVDTFRNRRWNFTSEKACEVDWITKADFEKLIVRLVEGFFGHSNR
jgi:hypothetical protein